MTFVNNTLNKVHELGQPEQQPLTRLGSTRIWSIACAVFETISLTFIPWHIGTALITCSAKCFKYLMHEALPEAAIFKNAENPAASIQALKRNCIQAAKAVAGLASTLFFGIIFCPELNFRIHLHLGLAVDNFSVKKQKELQAKLTAEKLAQEISQARTARFEAFEATRNALWANERAEQAIDNRLADLVLQQKPRPTVG